MTNEKLAAKELREFKIAQWDGFKEMAQRLKNHHILGTELVRTINDETIAVITVAYRGEPVQYVVWGDAQGRVKAQQPTKPHLPPLTHGLAGETRAAATAGTPDTFALGEPPIKQPPTPGIVALGAALLASAFGLGEQVPPGA